LAAASRLGRAAPPILAVEREQGAMEKRAVILAGGLGTRLRPYTVALPKPLVPVGDKPILEIIVHQLVSHGFTHLTFAVNHQADIVRAYFGTGEKYGARIDYSLERQPLSTMGPLKLIDGLPAHFLVMNGDVLTDLDYTRFFEHHTAQNHLMSISANSRQQVVDFGVLEADSAGRLTGFQEKPHHKFLVSMGIYAVDRAILEYIPAGIPYGFDHLVHDLLKAGQSIGVVPYEGYWLDIGRPDDYERAALDFSRSEARFLKRSS
jgi:NDP-mannose synthase